MVVAVYTNLSGHSSSDPFPQFVEALPAQLAKAYPYDNFYWIRDEGGETETNTGNLKTISIKPATKLFYNYSLSRKINQQIKKLKVVALLAVNAVIDTNTHQCVLIGSPGKKFQKANFEEIPSIFCLSETVKSDLIDQCGVDHSKIRLLYGGPSLLLQSMSDAEKTTFKEKYTDGKEYFLYRGAFNSPNIVQLLKAFSTFKKRQKSTMKMVLLSKTKPEEKEFPTLLNTYKYRDDVVLVDEDEKDLEIQLIASAFAYIQPYRSNSLCFVFDALQNNIPVLIDASSPLIEIDSDSALCFDTHSAEDIADALMRIYKDEKLYAELVERGKELIKKDYWDETVSLIWKGLKVKED